MLINIFWGFLCGSIAVVVLASAIFFMYKIQRNERLDRFLRIALYSSCVLLILLQYAAIFYFVLQVDLGSLKAILSFALSFLSALLVTGSLTAFFYQKFLD